MKKEEMISLLLWVRKHYDLKTAGIEDIVNEYMKPMVDVQPSPEIAIIKKNSSAGYWYSQLANQQFKVRTAYSAALSGVEGFAGINPNLCWMVTEGEHRGDIILKSHCVQANEVFEA